MKWTRCSPGLYTARGGWMIERLWVASAPDRPWTLVRQGNLLGRAHTLAAAKREALALEEAGPARPLRVVPDRPGEPAMCRWARHSEDEPRAAVSLVTLERPCGHDGATIPTCSDCLGVVQDRPQAPRPTPCSVCGLTNHPTVIEAEPLGWTTPEETPRVDH